MFHPDARNRRHQQYCAKDACRKASKTARQARWRAKPENRVSLYLFLCTVADAQGLSYYSDTRLGELLGLSGADLRAARSELRSAGLIAWQSPLYQVLSLERVSEAPPATPPPPRTGEVRSAAELLRTIMQEGLQ